MQDIVIVIDPGHGGSNEGALYEGYTEKEMTLLVAKAMKEELEQYEGIKCYLTRIDDIDMSLQERADYAMKLNADFLCCLHFNMSANHDLYGAECWISGFDTCYSIAYDFSTIEMNLLTNTGLFDRGIKTRINNKNEDYYGIIRHSTEYKIPSVIIEHCHLDNYRDKDFYNNESLLINYGKIDATAVAQFYGLKSKILNIDYSNLVYNKTDVPDKIMYPDKTAPLFCKVNSFNINKYTGEAKVTLHAFDEESRIMYYQYSLDGGNSFSEYYPWTGTEFISFNLDLSQKNNYEIIFSVDNMYNLKTYSLPVTVNDINLYSIDNLIRRTPDIKSIEVVSAMNDTAKSNSNNNTQNCIIEYFIVILLLTIFAITLCITKWLIIHKNKEKLWKKQK